MTYQVVFCGSDGAVIASDRLEGQFRPDGTIARGNDITKLKVSGEFAWAFSGGVLATMFAEHLSEIAKDMRNLVDEQLVELFDEHRLSVFTQWGQSGPDSTSRVLFVRGTNRSVFKINPVPHTAIERLGNNRGLAGQLTNTASFVFHRIHSPEMSVKALLPLAAYSVRAANFFDSAAIDGLDMAVYQEPESSFRFIDAKPYLDCAGSIEGEIRRVLEKFSFDNQLR